MEARMPHIRKPDGVDGRGGTVAFTGSSVKITHADVLASHGSPHDPTNVEVGLPDPDEHPPIEWPTSAEDAGPDIAATRANFDAAKTVAMKQVNHDMELLLSSVNASARQIAKAHTALTQQAQHHLQLSAKKTAEYVEVLLQASSYAEFQSNEATMIAGQLASQLVETSEQMHKVGQIRVDIHRCHAALDELDILMDDMERQEEMEKETALAHQRLKHMQLLAAQQQQQHGFAPQGAGPPPTAVAGGAENHPGSGSRSSTVPPNVPPLALGGKKETKKQQQGDQADSSPAQEQQDQQENTLDPPQGEEEEYDPYF